MDFRSAEGVGRKIHEQPSWHELHLAVSCRARDERDFNYASGIPRQVFEAPAKRVC